MSIDVELNGKAGRICHLGQAGTVRCPMRVHAGSEDVLTGNVFGGLRHIRPHLWVSQLLNVGLGTSHHRQAYFKNFAIRLWERQERFPPELLRFTEGRSEPDIILEWENPEPTSVWIEAKYRSGLAEGTANCSTNDQVIRGVRTLLATTGHIRPSRLFSLPRRRPYWLALMNRSPDPLVSAYQADDRLEKALPRRVTELPQEPFIGTITWRDIRQTLAVGCPRMVHTERSVANQVIAYLDLKAAEMSVRSPDRFVGVSPVNACLQQRLPMGSATERRPYEVPRY